MIKIDDEKIGWKERMEDVLIYFIGAVLIIIGIIAFCGGGIR